jgi:hypothetical protein
VPQSQLYSPHSRALTVEFGNIENVAAHTPEVFLGTAGAVHVRTKKSGYQFYARKYRGGDGRQRVQYVSGPVGDEQADALAEDMRARIAEIKSLVPSLRMLGREGFNLADPKTYTTIGALHNHGVFNAGGILIGSHAYGVLLNKLGVRGTPFATDDIDIARREALAFPGVPSKGLLEILRETGLDFVDVPQLDRLKPPTSFKEKGKSRFHVDLLVPSPNEEFPTVPVPELNAHATGLPYLKYLLAESQPATLIAREGFCAVRVPIPERFATHKIVVSSLRTGRGAKSEKDLMQASILAAAVADIFPGALEEAVEAMSKRMFKRFKKALSSAKTKLADSPRAWEELTRRKA